MGDLTKNLSASEFACECKYPECHHKKAAHMPLVLAIQDVADYFEQEYAAERVIVHITGPNRCPRHNYQVQIDAGKTPDEANKSRSTHMDCIAADFKIFVEVMGERSQVPPSEVYDYLDDKNPNSCGIGLYSNRVHFDTRTTKARWG